MSQAKLARPPLLVDTRRGRIVRLIAPVSKTGIPQGIVGSNPTLSAS